jgi:Holliday junction resolvase RusA-like endonuclease
MYIEVMLSATEDVICFTVPYLVPVTGNHYKRPCRYTGRDSYSHLGFKVTKEARAFYDAVAIFAQGRTVAPADDKERKRARYSVRIDVYLGAGQRGDFDNFFKCGLDSLVRCGVIHSDACVDGETSKCVVHRDERHNPRTEYLISRLEETRG